MGLGAALLLLLAAPAHVLPPARGDRLIVRGAEPERLTAWCRTAGARATVPDPHALGLPAPGAGRRWEKRSADLLLLAGDGRAVQRLAKACPGR